MSTKDIYDQIQERYGMELSAEMVSKIADRIHYIIREESRILCCAAYIVLGITADGYKDILSITVGANKTSTPWCAPVRESALQ